MRAVYLALCWLTRFSNGRTLTITHAAVTRTLGNRTARHVGLTLRLLRSLGAITVEAHPGGPNTYTLVRTPGKLTLIPVSAFVLAENGKVRWSDLAVLAAMESLGPRLGSARVLDVRVPQAAIAERAACSVRTIQRVIVDLRHVGLLTVRGAVLAVGELVRRTVNTYRLLMVGYPEAAGEASARARSYAARRAATPLTAAFKRMLAARGDP